jgi:hypothetical protein
MALYYSANGIVADQELHVGNTEGIKLMRGRADSVSCLQADGDELEAIREQFTGIPMHNGRVVEWFGDTAKFIARHFKSPTHYNPMF